VKDARALLRSGDAELVQLGLARLRDIMLDERRAPTSRVCAAAAVLKYCARQPRGTETWRGTAIAHLLRMLREESSG
jgi:hypothetical protein